MPSNKAERLKLIRKIEEQRESKVLTFLTSLRPNCPSQISNDAVRQFFDHLLKLPSRPIPRLDLFLCSNGGDGVVPWRLVSLFREFSKEFNVIIPYRAYSAATLLALGADEIVMHPFGEMGPIDPTVQNDFNPVDQTTGKRVGISVEDVKAYVNFIKSTVGITHEDELVKTIEILAEKIHPLALGNVERFLAQSRMIAKKILQTHKNELDDHTINEIIETMASRLYFHGHPINRKEAKEELGLKINDDLPPDLESVIWSLYLEYEELFQNQAIHDPASMIMEKLRSVYDPEQQSYALRDAELEFELVHSVIECEKWSSIFITQNRLSVQNLGPNGEPQIRQDRITSGWHQEPMASGLQPHQERETPPQEAPSAG